MRSCMPVFLCGIFILMVFFSVFLFKVNIDSLDITDIVDQTLSRNDLPMLVAKVRDQWLMQRNLIVEVEKLRNEYVLLFYNVKLIIIVFPIGLVVWTTGNLLGNCSDFINTQNVIASG